MNAEPLSGGKQKRVSAQWLQVSRVEARWRNRALALAVTGEGERYRGSRLWSTDLGLFQTLAARRRLSTPSGLYSTVQYGT